MLLLPPRDDAMILRALGTAMAAALLCLAPLAAPGQAPAGRGQQRGGGADGRFSPLVPRGIDVILANPLDNSLIVRDPPVQEAGAPPRLAVQAQWLEIVRGPDGAVQRFRTVESPATVLMSGRMGEVRIATGGRLATQRVRLSVEDDGTVTGVVYAADDPGTAAHRIEKRLGARLGDSVIVRGLISPRADGSQRETYLQLSFSKPAEAASAARSQESSRQAPEAPARGCPTGWQ